MRLAVLMALAILSLCAATPTLADMQCPNGAFVDVQSRCKFFATFRADDATIDSRIQDRLAPGKKGGARSIALIVAIAKYPKLAASEQLAAAGNDADKLEKFLIDDQEFDEVIVLRDGDATADNINYFLETYVPQRGIDFNFQSRFLFAYSGHGLPESPTRSPSFLLSAAKSTDDSAHMYGMYDLGTRLQKISKNYFHVLALINACYGGDIYNNGFGVPGGNPSISEQRGSYALTAGSDLNPVASFGGQQDGSVFFDTIIDGIKRGQADPDYARVVSGDGTLLQQGGITRLGALSTYLDTEFEIINHKKIPYGTGYLKLDVPWVGPVEPPGVRAFGGFFFLSPIRVAENQTPIAVPAGPLSSIPGHPDIKVFSGVEEYPIKGIDVSHAEGFIDWPKVANNYRFAYIRVRGWPGHDVNFDSNWKKAAATHLDLGGYMVFDYCLNPQQQVAAVLQSLKPNDKLLQIAIDVETPPANLNGKQYDCYKRLGPEGIRQALLDLARRLTGAYSKIPLIYGTRDTLSKILDDRFDPYMVWLALYKSAGVPSPHDIALTGHNPWTMWQFTAHETVVGIGRDVDVNVFFGSEGQYGAFKEAKSNVAVTTQAILR